MVPAYIAMTLELRTCPRGRRGEYRQVVNAWCGHDFFSRGRRLRRHRLRMITSLAI
jgi:hypothetical protein